MRVKDELALDDYRAALKSIAELKCGVAGGCGASVIAQRVLENRDIEWCASCLGTGWLWRYAEGRAVPAWRVRCDDCPRQMQCRACTGTGYPPEGEAQ
jgi:hypothetical protein